MTHRRPQSAPVGPMSDAHAAATTLELIRLCLGGRPERTELIPTRLEIMDFWRRKMKTPKKGRR